MYILKMMGGDKFNITEEDLKDLAGKSGLVPIRSIKSFVNMSSVSSIIPAELDNRSGNRRLLKDGTYAILRGGVWVTEKDPSVRLDIKCYPELRTPEEQARIQEISDQQDRIKQITAEAIKKLN